jgi:demethylspheroidene O-methyltransferase
MFRLKSSEEVFSIMEAAISSAALNTALEERLFWRLADAPAEADQIARELDIPHVRCRYWLELLVSMDLLTCEGAVYAPTAAAREAILEAYGPDVWMQFALESRERTPVLQDLTRNIHHPGSVWENLGMEAPNYMKAMRSDPDRARRFTRMLGELHQELAEDLSAALDLKGVRRLLDLGGGSGVMSTALLSRYPELEVVVVDLPAVCEAGRELVADDPASDRIEFQPADFVTEPLPAGFDCVLECDINFYSLELFRKLRATLNPGGRFVICDLLSPAEGEAPPPRLHWAFRNSLADPDFSFPTVDRVRALLESAEFEISDQCSLPGDWILITARA